LDHKSPVSPPLERRFRQQSQAFAIPLVIINPFALLGGRDADDQQTAIDAKLNRLVRFSGLTFYEGSRPNIKRRHEHGACLRVDDRELRASGAAAPLNDGIVAGKIGSLACAFS